MPGEGFEGFMSISEEVTYGTSTGVGEVYARIMPGGDTIKVDESIKEYPGISGPGVRKVFHGNRRILGVLEPEIHFEGMIGKLLKNSLGTYVFAVDTPVVGANTHTFTMGKALPTGLTLEDARGDVTAGNVFQYLGGLVDQLTIQFDPEAFLRLIPSFSIRDEVTGVVRSGAPVYPTDRPIFWDYVANMTIAGTAIPILSGSIVLNNNLQKERFRMAKLLTRPKRLGRRQCTGSVVGEFEDLILYDKYIASTEGNLDLKFTSTEFVTGATPYSFQLTATVSHLTGETPNTASEAPIEITLPFRMLSETAEFQIVLINGEATYA